MYWPSLNSESRKLFGALEQKLHGEENALELADPRNGQIAGLGGPAGQKESLVLIDQLLDFHIDAHMDGRSQTQSLPLVTNSRGDPPSLFPASWGGSRTSKDPRYDHHARKRLPCDPPCSTGLQPPIRPAPNPTMATLLTGALTGRLRRDPTFREAAIDNGVFDVLDGDGRINDFQDTGALAGCRTSATREFGKVIGLVQTIQGFTPLSLIDQLVSTPESDCRWDNRSRIGKRAHHNPCSGLLET